MLHDLDTLDIRGLEIEELPSAIVLLTKLQYLFTGESCKVPNRIGNMKNLRGIHCFDITENSLAAVEDLGNLTRLNTLSLRWGNEEGEGHKRHEEIILSSLCKLSSSKLHSLHIATGGGSMDFIDSWSPPVSSLRIFQMDGDTYLWNVPKWISPGLTSLSHLGINLTELREEGLHTLGSLPSLLILNLRLGTGPDKMLTVIGFPCLKKFQLYSSYGAYVTFKKGAMPKLEMFEMSFDVSVNVAETHGFYLGIEHVLCLKVIKVDLKQGDTLLQYLAVAAVIKEVRAHPNHPKFIYRESRGEYVDVDNSDHIKRQLQWVRGSVESLETDSAEKKEEARWMRGSVQSLETDGGHKKKQARWKWKNNERILPDEVVLTCAR
ncbi:Disease resistance protein RPM1 [Hordeum vulgare]|nr:Disease resistance protein RPM1 [Hordeum vulgare]